MHLLHVVDFQLGLSHGAGPGRLCAVGVMIQQIFRRVACILYTLVMTSAPVSSSPVQVQCRAAQMIDTAGIASCPEFNYCKPGWWPVPSAPPITCSAA